MDEAALAACLAYVDLNPIRAGMAGTLQPKELLPFVGNPRQNMPKGLPFRLNDYLELVDWTGRIVRADKRGSIANNIPPILRRLNIAPAAWIRLATEFEGRFPGMVGREASIQQACVTFGKLWVKGSRNCRALFAPS